MREPNIGKHFALPVVGIRSEGLAVPCAGRSTFGLASFSTVEEADLARAWSGSQPEDGGCIPTLPLEGGDRVLFAPPPPHGGGGGGGGFGASVVGVVDAPPVLQVRLQPRCQLPAITTSVFLVIGRRFRVWVLCPQNPKPVLGLEFLEFKFWGAGSGFEV